ncbi:hypothetical protein D3C87_256740 [compost metagenome]
MLLLGMKYSPSQNRAEKGGNLLKTFLTPLIFLSLSATAQTHKISASLYDLKSERTKKLYTVDISLQQKDGLFSIHSIFKDLAGNTVVEEKGEVLNGEIVTYEISQLQSKDKGWVTVRDGEVLFTYEDSKGKKKTDKEKLRKPLVATINFNDFVMKNWSTLEEGKEIDIRFAVWDRLETVGFTLKKVGEPELDGEKTMEIRMKPTSMLIAALVDPIYLWYSQKDHLLRAQKGRVAPKLEKQGQWKSLDAETVYTKD